MAGITHGGTLPDSAQKTDFYAIIDNGTISNIANADISATAAIADTKLAQITTASKVATSAITDGDIDLAKITGDSLHLEETTAPSTAAGEGALYTKDTSGQPELFYREESDGDEVQITSGGSALGFQNTFMQANGTSDITTTSTSLVNMTDMTLTLSAGTWLIMFSGAIKPTAASTVCNVALKVGDNVRVTTQCHPDNAAEDGNNTVNSVSLHWGEILSEETVVVVQWLTPSGTQGQPGASANRVLTAVKLSGATS